MHHYKPRKSLLSGVALLILVVGCLLGQTVSAQTLNQADQRMLDRLTRRLELEPGHADSWRLVAKLYHRNGMIDEAANALELALENAPELVAAHYDLGMLKEELGDAETAASHFQRVFQLGPETTYADKLRAQGRMPREVALPASDPTFQIQTVGYQIRSFDGSDRNERNLEMLRQRFAGPVIPRWRWYLETGLLYNSNVSLTPVSRELFDLDAAAFQFVLSPETEYDVWRRDLMRSGFLGRGNWTVNDADQRDLDLSSYQLGWFIEHDQLWDQTAGRVDYVFTADWLDQRKFGTRHALNLSLNHPLDELRLLTLYGSINSSDFTDDGADPAIESLDGPGGSIGVSWYQVCTGEHRWESLTAGIELDGADTRGADYRFFGVGAYVRGTLDLAEAWKWEPSGGWAYRSYPDFTGLISRDENIIRAESRLRYLVSETMEFAGVAAYDRFASKNADFDADRLQGGLLLILRQ